MSSDTAVIDLALEVSVSDGRRHFDLSVRLETDAGFVALYGPSGSGKSLTLQAVAGLLRPRRGHVRVRGRSLFDTAAGIDLPPSQRRVGYLFQDYALFPHLTVRQNVAFGLTSWRRRALAPEQRTRVDALLESFGLAHMADSRPHTLSGGQQQRVALARALACEPELLLLDEPFAALNPMLRGELRRELGEACRRWSTPALMITHDVEDVLALAEMCYVYEEGRILRSVDLRTGLAADAAHAAVTGAPPAVQTPAAQRLRRLVLGQAAD